MNSVIVAVRDAKADIYGIPNFVHNTATAIRSFSDQVNNPESQWHKHPSDYALYELGVYDDQTGSFSMLDIPKHLIQADQCISITDVKTA